MVYSTLSLSLSDVFKTVFSQHFVIIICWCSTVVRLKTTTVQYVRMYHIALQCRTVECSSELMGSALHISISAVIVQYSIQYCTVPFPVLVQRRVSCFGLNCPSSRTMDLASQQPKSNSSLVTFIGKSVGVD